MPKWTDYTIKTTVADNDEIMTLDTAGKANKRLSLSTLSDWVLGKIADKVFEKLQTNDKTILGAINELNSNKISNTRFAVQHIYYSDSQAAELGGLDACVRDALNNTILKDGAFYGTFVSNRQYLMIGYRYANGGYGCIILFGYNNNTERWNINNGKVTKS